MGNWIDNGVNDPCLRVEVEGVCESPGRKALPFSLNGQLRTGADKGNPTV